MYMSRGEILVAAWGKPCLGRVRIRMDKMDKTRIRCDKDKIHYFFLRLHFSSSLHLFYSLSHFFLSSVLLGYTSVSLVDQILKTDGCNHDDQIFILHAPRLAK